jgi:hypothetical protein
MRWRNPSPVGPDFATGILTHRRSGYLRLMEEWIARCQRAYKAPLFFDIDDLDAYIRTLRITAR